jgi:hypothetical protein
MIQVRQFLGLVLVVLTVGCGTTGPEVASVSGTITLDGKPLENATVTFQPVSGRPSFGTTDKDGKYEMGYTLQRSGVMLGKNSVYIRTRMENESGQVVQKEFLPAKYHDRSELTAEVEKKANVIDFQLSSK